LKANPGAAMHEQQAGAGGMLFDSAAENTPDDFNEQMLCD